MNCETCGQALKVGGLGRPQTKYCSRRCKDAARTAEHRLAVDVKLAARKCENCGGRISPAAGGKARTCSRACGMAWQNAKRAAKRRAVWLASEPRCERCNKPIPETRRAGVKFCSAECKRNASSARWRENAPGYMREYLYGLSADDYETIFAAQDGRCAICRTNEWPGRHNKPHVDHDHTTGKVRGILCTKCNNGLGNFADDPARLRAAADYLAAF